MGQSLFKALGIQQEVLPDPFCWGKPQQKLDQEVDECVSDNVFSGKRRKTRQRKGAG